MKRTYYILAATVVLLIGLFYYWGVNSDKPRYEWDESGWEKKTYSEQSDQPYGTSVLYNLLDNYFPSQEFKTIEKSLVSALPQDTSKGKGTYVFVGSGMYLDSADTQHLLHFVRAGNTALIISKTIPFDLMNLIYYEECPGFGLWEDYATHYDTLVRQKLIGMDKLGETEVYYARQNIKGPYNWSSIGSEVFCRELDNYPLGYLEKDSLINFASFACGQGRFLLHTTPLNFTNYHLLRPQTQRYAEAVLSYVPEGPIWWDGFSRVPEMVARERNNSRDSSRLREDHVLSYILKHEALAWAWYILLALGGLYLVFRATRKQRPIPVLPKNENSSFEFISTIADLHYKSGNYKGICVQAMKLFLNHIREKYDLSAFIDPQTNHIVRMDEGYMHKLSVRSGVNQQQIEVLFAQYDAIAHYEPTEQHAIDLYLSMEQFVAHTS